MKKLAEVVEEIDDQDILVILEKKSEDIKIKFVSDYLLKGILGLALVNEKMILISKKLKNFPNFLQKVITHELEHIEDPGASELEIRRRTGTLFPAYSIY